MVHVTTGKYQRRNSLPNYTTWEDIDGKKERDGKGGGEGGGEGGEGKGGGEKGAVSGGRLGRAEEGRIETKVVQSEEGKERQKEKDEHVGRSGKGFVIKTSMKTTKVGGMSGIMSRVVQETNPQHSKRGIKTGKNGVAISPERPSLSVSSEQPHSTPMKQDMVQIQRLVCSPSVSAKKLYPKFVFSSLEKSRAVESLAQDSSDSPPPNPPHFSLESNTVLKRSEKKSSPPLILHIKKKPKHNEDTKPEESEKDRETNKSTYSQEFKQRIEQSQKSEGDRKRIIKDTIPNISDKKNKVKFLAEKFESKQHKVHTVTKRDITTKRLSVHKTQSPFPDEEKQESKKEKSVLSLHVVKKDFNGLLKPYEERQEWKDGGRKDQQEGETRLQLEKGERKDSLEPEVKQEEEKCDKMEKYTVEQKDEENKEVEIKQQVKDSEMEDKWRQDKVLQEDKEEQLVAEKLQQEKDRELEATRRPGNDHREVECKEKLQEKKKDEFGIEQQTKDGEMEDLQTKLRQNNVQEGHTGVENDYKHYENEMKQKYDDPDSVLQEEKLKEKQLVEEDCKSEEKEEEEIKQQERDREVKELEANGREDKAEEHKENPLAVEEHKTQEFLGREEKMMPKVTSESKLEQEELNRTGEQDNLRKGKTVDNQNYLRVQEMKEKQEEVNFRGEEDSVSRANKEIQTRREKSVEAIVMKHALVSRKTWSPEPPEQMSSLESTPQHEHRNESNLEFKQDRKLEVPEPGSKLGNEPENHNDKNPETDVHRNESELFESEMNLMDSFSVFLNKFTSLEGNSSTSSSLPPLEENENNLISPKRKEDLVEEACLQIRKKRSNTWSSNLALGLKTTSPHRVSSSCMSSSPLISPLRRERLISEASEYFRKARQTQKTPIPSQDINNTQRNSPLNITPIYHDDGDKHDFTQSVAIATDTSHTRLDADDRGLTQSMILPYMVDGTNRGSTTEGNEQGPFVRHNSERRRRKFASIFSWGRSFRHSQGRSQEHEDDRFKPHKKLNKKS